MSVNPFSPDSMHYVDPEALKGLHETNETMLGAKYAGDVASVRAGYLGKLAQVGALIDGDGWALFDLERASWGNVAVLERPKKMFVHVNHPMAGKFSTPTIRIFTHEAFDQGSSTMYLTEDVTLDHENDAQMLVSVAEVKDESKFIAQAATFEVADGTVEATPSHASLFLLTNNSFQLINTFNYTPIWGIPNPKKPEDDPILPFGKYTCLEDKWYALSRAKELFAAIVDLEPIAQRAD